MAHQRESVRVAVFEYIETFYNPRCRHSALGYLSPMEYEYVTRKRQNHLRYVSAPDSLAAPR